MSARQPACAKVSAAAIATCTPDETARLHLAEVLGQMEASPWSGVLTMTILGASWPSSGRTAWPKGS
jgi:hypothetical protein